jgi:hypothetical protein
VSLAIFAIETIDNSNNQVHAAVVWDDITELNPYEINTADDWLYLANNWSSLNNQYFIYVKVKANISFKNKTFTRLGTDAYPFNGFFDGGGKVFTGISYKTNEIDQNIGVFGVIAENSEVKNLGIFEAEIEGDDTVGALVGKNYGNITSCFANANISSSGLNTGGLVGYNSGTISVSYSSGTISFYGVAPTLSHVGGLVGYMDGGSVSYSYSFTKFNAIGSEILAGGLIGGVYDNQVEKNEKPTFLSSFFASDIFTVSLNKCVGVNKDDTIDYNTNASNASLRAISNLTIENANINNTLLGTVGFNISALQGAWQNNFKMNDASAFFGPSLALFNNSDDTKDYSFNSVIVRRFGALPGASGTWGTEPENPYVISTTQHFTDIAEAVLGQKSTAILPTDYMGKFFLLDKDIDFNGNVFIPIGSEARQFRGTFNGGGHVLSNIALSAASGATDNLALFRFVGSGGLISNLKIDSTCSVQGGVNVGGLVAVLTGATISDVIVESYVSGRDSIGGIVGRAQGGAKIQNSLSNASVRYIEKTAACYGIVGTSGASLANTWYVISSNSGDDHAKMGAPTGAGANVLETGDESALSATLANGIITFTAINSEGQLKPVYRNMNEETVAGSGAGLYIAQPNDTNITIYLRFVRSISLIEKVKDNEDNEIATIEFSLPNGSKTAMPSEYYDGQSVTLSTKIAYGYYLKAVYALDEKSSETTINDFALTYIDNTEAGDSIQLNISFLILSNIETLSIHVGKIFPDETPVLDKEYNGEAVLYEYNQKDLVESYNVSYSFSTGLAPAAAGENYSITINILRDVIVVGRESIIFTISQKSIKLDETVFLNETDESLNKYYPYKEYDGVSNSSVYINKNKIGFLPNDVANINVTATASYGQVDVGNNITAIFFVTMNGIGASNYTFENPQFTYSYCMIIKRQVVMYIEDAVNFNPDDAENNIFVLTRYYTGNTGIAPILSTKAVVGKDTVSAKELRLTISFYKFDIANNAKGEEISIPIDIGYYFIEISPQETFGGSYYEVKLDRPYILEIVKTPIDVVFSPSSEAIYDPGGINISVTFTFGDISGSPGTVTYYYYNSEGEKEAVDGLLDVGTYALVVENFENMDYPYFVLKRDENGDSLARTIITVIKKDPDLRANDNLQTLVYGDTKVQLTLDGDDADQFDNDKVIWSSTSNLIEISKDNQDGNWYLDIKGAGSVQLSFRVEGNNNYNEANIPTTLMISKKNVYFSLISENISLGYGDNLVLDNKYLNFEELDHLPSGYIPPHFSIENGPTTNEYTSTSSIQLPINEQAYYGLIITEWTGSQMSSDNYVFIWDGENDPTFKLTITPRNVYLKVDNKEIFYANDDVSLTYTLHDTTADGKIIEPGIYENHFSAILERISGSNAGDYVISVKNISSDGVFVNLSDSPTGVYTILKRDVSIIMKGADDSEGGYYTKVYNTPDPTIEITSIIIRDVLTGEDADFNILDGYENSAMLNYFIRNAGENIPADANYGEYAYILTDELPLSSNYNVSLVPARLRITKADPFIVIAESIDAQFRYKLGDLDISSVVSSSPEGSFIWKDPEYLLAEFTTMLYKYPVIFNSQDPNYKDSELQLAVHLVARILSIEYTIPEKLVYTGTPLNSLISYKLGNLREGDELNPQLTFSIINDNNESIPISDVMEARSYKVDIMLNSLAYTLPDDIRSRSFIVEKAKLNITLEPLTYDAGSYPPEARFVYSGFVANENESTINLFSTIPSVELPRVVGIFDVTPANAVARNYLITYTSAKVTVNAIQLVGGDNFTVSGSFNPNLTIELTPVARSDSGFIESVNLFNTYRESSATLNTREISGLYSFETLLDNQQTTFTTKNAKAQLKLSPEIAEKSSGGISVIYFTDGKIKLAKNILLSGDTVSFDLEECDYFAILTPEEGKVGQIVLYVLIGIGALGVLLLICYIIYTKKKNKMETLKPPKKKRTVVAQVKH